jgi:hypothetical protein
MGMSSKDLRHTKLKREVRALLNKISPENEASIFSQLCGFHIEAEDHAMIAALVIEKAINDPFYSEVYARAIGKLCGSKVTQPVGYGGGCTSPWSHDAISLFVTSVLEQCQSTFDVFFGRFELLGGGRGGASATPGGGRRCSEAEGEETRRKQFRAQAYMRFLGHLYMARVVSTEVLQHCVQKLLLVNSSQDRTSTTSGPQLRPPQVWIECACELLYPVGRDVCRTKSGKAFLEDTMRHLNAWKDTSDPETEYFYPTRIRFKIEEIAEAHRRGWPTPLDEKGVHMKAKCKMRPARIAFY